jgi:hypothetical protein
MRLRTSVDFCQPLVIGEPPQLTIISNQQPIIVPTNFQPEYRLYRCPSYPGAEYTGFGRIGRSRLRITSTPSDTPKRRIPGGHPLQISVRTEDDEPCGRPRAGLWQWPSGRQTARHQLAISDPQKTRYNLRECTPSPGFCNKCTCSKYFRKRLIITSHMIRNKPTNGLNTISQKLIRPSVGEVVESSQAEDCILLASLLGIVRDGWALAFTMRAERTRLSRSSRGVGGHIWHPISILEATSHLS